MTGRRRRHERRPGVRVVLGPRDEALLRSLARFRIAQTSSLVQLCFQSVRRDTAAVRLRRLFDAGFLSVISSALNAENVYSIGPVGVRWLEDRGVPCGRVPQGAPEHHLGIVDVWVRLAIALHGHGTARLARFTPDWEYRSELAGGGALVVPDGTIVLTVGDEARGARELRVFLEMDLGTERQGVLARKLVAYQQSMPVDDAWLAVVLAEAGERRVAAVERLVTQHWPSSSLVCRQSEWPEALLTRLGVLRPTLATSPNDKGSPKAPIACATGAAGGQGEVPSR